MKKLYARYYDVFMKLFERKLIDSWRKDLLQHAKGTVLEIGAGTGINFPIYCGCNEVVAIEPNRFMINKSIKRQKQASVPIKIVESIAEELPYPDEYFDTIVITLVLCSVKDPNQVLKEINRVLKPNGTILILEHVKMNHPIYSRLQSWFTPLWKKVCDGCHLNRETGDVIDQSGLRIISKRVYLRGFAISIIAAKN